MSSLDLITNKIISDANDSAALRIERANEEARRIFERKAEAADQECERLRTESSLNMERLRYKNESAAKAMAGKRILAEKGRLIEDGILKAREVINNLPLEDAFDMISRFVRHSLEGIQEPAILVLSDKDLGRVPAKFIDKLSSDVGADITLSEHPGDFDAGCIVICGLVEYNGTLDALVREYHDQLSDTIGAFLFSELSQPE